MRISDWSSDVCSSDLLSTDYVFDGRKGSPYREDDAISPLNAYGRSKAAGEAAVRTACPAHVILRTSWVFGAAGANFVKNMLRLAGERSALSRSEEKTSELQSQLRNSYAVFCLQTTNITLRLNKQET